MDPRTGSFGCPRASTVSALVFPVLADHVTKDRRLAVEEPATRLAALVPGSHEEQLGKPHGESTSADPTRRFADPTTASKLPLAPRLPHRWRVCLHTRLFGVVVVGDSGMVDLQALIIIASKKPNQRTASRALIFLWCTFETTMSCTMQATLSVRGGAGRLRASRRSRTLSVRASVGSTTTPTATVKSSSSRAAYFATDKRPIILFDGTSAWSPWNVSPPTSHCD